MVLSAVFAAALSLTADTFTFGGDADWTDEGNGVWKSGSISDGQSSYAEMFVVGPVAVSFKWKTSSESGCDTLTFEVDGGYVNGISGEMDDWEDFAYIVGNGTHSLRWTYSKDGSVSTGDDCGWIKNVATNDVTYTYGYIDNSDGTVTLARYDDYGNWISDGVTPSPVGDFTIPSEIDGKTVVAISDNYFDGYGMTSVAIPASVTNISCYAFPWAYDLTNITVAAGNPAYKDIDGILYTKDGKALVTCPHSKGGAVAIASGTECIGPYAFNDNGHLTSVSIPAGVKVIESSAFRYCWNGSFTSVTIPASVETIGPYAFGFCSSLATVGFAGVEGNIAIADTAFVATPYDAAKEFSLIVEYGSIVGIHGSAPENLVISNFSNGAAWAGIDYQALSAWNYDMSSMTNVVILEGVTYINGYAFAGDTALESVTLPMSLQDIRTGAFLDCTSLREITIPPGVNYVDNPFYGCTNLTVHAPDTLKDTFSVPEEDGCRIVYYTVPEHTVTFNANGRNLHYYDEESSSWLSASEVSLKFKEGQRLELPDVWSSSAADYFVGWFDANDVEVTSYTVITGDMAVSARWVVDDGTFQMIVIGNVLRKCLGSPVPDELHIPSGVTLIRANALPASDWKEVEGTHYRFLGWFMAVEGGEAIDLWSDVTIAGGATLYARWVEVEPEWEFDVEGGTAIITGNSVPLSGDVVIPASVTVEEDDGEGNVTEATCPVTVIGDSALSCMLMTSVTIPASVTNIQDWAFEDSYYLTNVVFEARMESIDMNVFSAFSGTPWLEAYIASLPAPENDDFADATVIEGNSGSVTGSNVGATLENGTSFTGGDNGDVWWKWTAPASGTFAFDTHGSNYDTAIAVYEGADIDDLRHTLVADDDDYYYDNTSRVEFEAEAGVTYRIAVGGYGIGSIALSWGLVPANDGNVSVDAAKATIEKGTGGEYVVTALDGVTLTVDDIYIDTVAREAYVIAFTDNAHTSAVVSLAMPLITAPADESLKAQGDATGLVVDIAKVDIDDVAARPAGSDEVVGALAVTMHAGLYYQAAWGSGLNNMEYGDKVLADGTKQYIGVIKQSGTTGFYKVTVSEK